MADSSINRQPYRVQETEHLVRSQKFLDPENDLHKVPMLNQYAILQLVGNGQHGKVHLAYDTREERHVAVKKVPREQKADKFRLLRQQPLPSTQHTAVAGRILTSEQKILREIAIMKKCSHANVVTLLEVINDPLSKKIYIVMEYLGGGEIKWRNDRNQPILTVDQTRRIIRDAKLGLEYLHFQGIIHRDIKPANLLWTKDRSQVKIADFGVSHMSFAQRLAGARADDNDVDASLFDEAEISKKAGTPSFLAPEVICDLTLEDDASEEWQNGSPGSPTEYRRPPITKAIDIWALGATMYCLLFGRTPFDPEPDPEMHPAARETRLYRAILHDDWVVDATMGYDRIPTGGRHPPDVPETEGYIVIHLLDHLMQKDVSRRMELSEIKKYKWFTRDLPNANDWLKTSYPGDSIAPSKSEVEQPFSEVRFRWREQISRQVSSILRPLRQTSALWRKPDPADVLGTKSDPSKGLEVSRPRATQSTPGVRKSRSTVKGKAKSQPSWDREQLPPLPRKSPRKYDRRNKSMDRYPPLDNATAPESSLSPPSSSKGRRGSETLLMPPAASSSCLIGPSHSSSSRATTSSSRPSSSHPSSTEERPRSRIAALWNWFPRSVGSSSSVPSNASQGSDRKGKQPAIETVAKSEEALFNKYSIEGQPEPSSSLTAERRASSWTDNARDYTDVTSLKSDFSEPDEQVLFVGAGGVSNEIPFFRRNHHQHSTASSSFADGATTPTLPATVVFSGSVNTAVPSHVDPYSDVGRQQASRSASASSPLTRVAYRRTNTSSSYEGGESLNYDQAEHMGIDSDSSGSSDLGSVRGHPYDLDREGDDDSEDSDDAIEIHTGRHRSTSPFSSPPPSSPPPSPPAK